MNNEDRRPGTAPLSEYDQKRDFALTPEPGPDSVARPSPSPRFMVHKHHARRLHYDLRLEIDGRLASWAVPRGPSYDPAIKRLAVQTEDHPLAYGDFEGRIPDGQYGAGESLVWDRGFFDTVPPGQVAAQRRKGHIHFALAGEKLRGEWHLLRTTAANGRRAAQGDASASGPKSQWLLIKLDDETANPALDIVAERPESVLTGQSETRGPAPAFRGSGAAAVKPSMPKLLASGVLGSHPAAKPDRTDPYESGARAVATATEVPASNRAPRTRTPTPLFAQVPLEEFQVDVTRPQELLDLPAHLFGEQGPPGAMIGIASNGAQGDARANGKSSAELLFLLKRTAPGRRKELGEVAEVAQVLRDLFTGLGLTALACTAGPHALLVRVPIAPAPAPGALERFAERLADTLSSQLEAVREGRVRLDRSLNRLHANIPALLEKLPGATSLVCAPLAWDDVTPKLSLAKFTSRWLASHRDAAEKMVADHFAAAATLPRAR